MKRNKQWDVQGAVGFAGLFHFLHSCASGCLVPFLTLYLRHLGLTALMTGAIMASKHVVALVWRPISSVLARRHNKQRTVIIGSIICSTAAALTLLFFPLMEVSSESGSCNVSQLSGNLTRYEFNISTLEPKTTPAQYSPVFHSTKPTVMQKDNKTDHHLNRPSNKTIAADHKTDEDLNEKTNQTGKHKPHGTKSAQPPPQRKGRSVKTTKQTPNKMEQSRFEFLGSLKVMDIQHQIFFLVMIIVSLWEIVAAPLEWTADDGLHEYLDFVDADDRHKLVKPLELLGFAAGVGGCGVLVSFLYCFVGTVLHFYTYTLVMILTLPVAALLPLYRHKRERVPSAGWKALYLVKGDTWAILCSVTALLTGLAGSVVSDFLLWQMQDHKATELQMGVALALVPLSQATFAPLYAKLIRLLKSPNRLLLLAVLGQSLQCLYYSFSWTPWAVLPAQLLAGFSTGALWWSLEAQSIDVASPGTEVAVQRIFQALFLDLGAGLGSGAGGFVAQKYGLRVLFQGAAAMLGLWCVTLAVLQWRIPRQRRINYSRLLVAEASDMSDSDSEQETDWLDKAIEEDKGNNNWKRLDK